MLSAATPTEQLPPEVRAVVALLVAYLPLKETKARAWAVKLVKELGPAVPPSTTPQRYHRAEIEAGLGEYMAVLGDGFPTYAGALEAVRVARKKTIAHAHDQAQDLERKALPERASEDPAEVERREAEAAAKNAARARAIVEDVMKRTGVVR